MPSVTRARVLLALLALALGRPAPAQAQAPIAPAELRAICPDIRVAAANPELLVTGALLTFHERGWPTDVSFLALPAANRWARLSLPERRARLARAQQDGLIFLATTLASVPRHPTRSTLAEILFQQLEAFLVVDPAIFAAYEQGDAGRASLALADPSEPLGRQWRAARNLQPIWPAQRTFWDVWFTSSEADLRASVDQWLRACDAVEAP